MTNWFDKQVDGLIDRTIGGAIDKKLDEEVDKLLEPHIGKDRLRRVKKLLQEGRPLDEDTEAMLREYLTETQLEQYRTIQGANISAVVARSKRKPTTKERMTWGMLMFTARLAYSA